MSEGRRLPLAEAQHLADKVLSHLMPACVDGMVCGSIRRRRAEVGDIDIVLLPKWSVLQASLFDDTPADPSTDSRECPELDALLQGWIYRGWVMRDPDGGWGQRERHLRLGPSLVDILDTRTANILRDIRIGLYFADERNFGNIVALRTGGKEFTRGAFVQIQKGGWLKHVYHAGGYLRLPLPNAPDEIIPCRTEEIFFERAKLPWIDPEDRGPGVDEKMRNLLRLPFRAPRDMASAPR